MRPLVLDPECTPHVMTHPEHMPKGQPWLTPCKDCQRRGAGSYIQGGLAGYAAHYVVVHTDAPAGVVGR